MAAQDYEWYEELRGDLEIVRDEFENAVPAILPALPQIVSPTRHEHSDGGGWLGGVHRGQSQKWPSVRTTNGNDGRFFQTGVSVIASGATIPRMD